MFPTSPAAVINTREARRAANNSLLVGEQLLLNASAPPVSIWRQVRAWTSNGRMLSLGRWTAIRGFASTCAGGKRGRHQRRHGPGGQPDGSTGI